MSTPGHAPTVSVLAVDLLERPVTLRLPFRFGAATVTHCPQAFVRVRLRVDGHESVGASAELMVPKWFDKSPALSHEDNFNQLRRALQLAAEAARQAGTHASTHPSAWALSQQMQADAIAAGTALGLPRLAAQFGPALLDKAVADAVLRHLGLGWVDGLGRGALGDPWSARLAGAGRLQRPQSVWLRHTVGLADRLEPGDPGTDPADGLPATLADAAQRQGLRWFKLKLSGQADADIDRLRRICAVLARQPHWQVTLDGNETFADAAALQRFWATLRATPDLHELLRRTVLLEQPLPRHLALATPMHHLGIDVPVILDESDDADDVLDRGLALGWGGISSKACKGIYRSLRNACELMDHPGALLSGEDLTCQAGLAVQQDTLLAASLGVTHIERNGHHYVDGFGIAPDAEAQAFARAHAGFYDGASRPHLRIEGGRLDLRSLHGPGFASAVHPDWDSLTPMQ